MVQHHRPRLRRCLSVPFALYLGSTLPQPASGQRMLALPPVPTEVSHGFTSISSVAELGDGRVVVVDRAEQSIVLVDFGAGKARRVGGLGDGPGETRLPWTVHARPNGGALVFDSGNQRFLEVEPDGTPGPTRPLPLRAAGESSLTMGIAGPAVVDPRGNMYWTSSLFTRGPGTLPNTLADSFPIQRVTTPDSRVDTLGWLRRPNATLDGDRGSRRADVLARYPLRYTDDWTILPDGTLIIVRAPEYMVELRYPGGQVATRRIPYQPVAVTPWHKARWRAGQRRRVRVVVSVSEGALGPPSLAGPSAPIEEPEAWPEYLPPFQAGETMADPAGYAWVARTPTGPDDPVRYDVVDAGGVRRLVVELPAGERVAAIRHAELYTIRSDRDDLLYLRSRALPHH